MEALAWPAAVAIIIIAALLIFQKPIGGLIGRVHKVKLPGGFHADASLPVQITEQAADNAAQPGAGTAAATRTAAAQSGHRTDRGNRATALGIQLQRQGAATRLGNKGIRDR